jgi:hypothetical protein
MTTAQDGLSATNVIIPLLNTLRGAPFSVPALYAELHAAIPGVNGTTALSAGCPARHPVVLGAASAGSVAGTGNPAVMLNNGITGETITDLALWSAFSNGTYWLSMPFTSPPTWNSMDTLTASPLSISLGPAASAVAWGLSTANLINPWLNTFGATQFAITPGQTYVQLHTAIAGANGTTAVSVGSTARQQVAFSPANNNSISISATPVAQWTNGGTSETITGISLWSAASSGTFWLSAPLGVSLPWTSTHVLTLSTLTVVLGPQAQSITP